ncbi:ABC transporter substrate-binding protein [Rhodococcus sp. 1R11]|uniref:ABC transporter substrate-binding protein n=1 Tax=Rhodococcus sp. 1R11 TaxID=2559614 RepID=UPI0014312F82|nr:ABC transporter substrate-binding protein [Rhodococcus sp. 1R11]
MLTATVLVTAACGGSSSDDNGLETLRLALTPNTQLLPIFAAIDSGAFEQAGIDLQIDTYQGAATAQIPRLVRGDIDLLPSTPSPSFFNSVTQGFDIKAILSTGTTGEAGTPSLVTVGTAADEIRDYSDLRGRTIDSGADGSVIQVDALEAIAKGGLTESDLTIEKNAKTAADMLALARNQSADVISTIEPVGSQIERLGLGKRWKVMNETAPWYPQVIIAASSVSLDQKSDAIEKFSRAYLKTIREINAQNGKWTDEYSASLAKWTGIAPADFTVDPMPTFDEKGTITAETLSRIQDIWMKQNLIQQEVDVTGLVDESIAERSAN